MISKISFPKTGKGYIYEKIQRPQKPTPPNNRFGESYREYMNCKDDKEKKEVYESMMAEYNKEMKYYNEHKGDYVLGCSNLLVGKTFEFEPHKVNVIFGPNGCGKTTILKALSGNALIVDGWTRLLDPMEFFKLDDDVNYAEELKEKLKKSTRNTCKIDWDGVPIYFENFADTERNYRQIGDLSDANSIFGDTKDEFVYHMNKSKMNLGSKSAMIINRVLNICEKPKTYNDILVPYEKAAKSYNNTWAECYNAQIDYFKSLPKANSGEPNTILFDEIDKSLDIENVLYLYTELLPRFAEKYGVQFILVSHSPIILSDKVFNDERYNIVSMDKEYTERCRNLLK